MRPHRAMQDRGYTHSGFQVRQGVSKTGAWEQWEGSLGLACNHLTKATGPQPARVLPSREVQRSSQGLHHTTPAGCSLPG